MMAASVMGKHRLSFGMAVLSAIIAVVLAAMPAKGQQYNVPEPKVLTGVLKQIRERGSVRLGYRQNAVPFSMEGPDGLPYGYTIDLCHAVVSQIGDAIGGRLLAVEYRRVTPANRIDLVAGGAIDLECGATTNTTERSGRVAFSPAIFVTGTKLAVTSRSPIRSYRDLNGRTVAVARGTTNEAVIRHLVAGMDRLTTVTTTNDIAEAFDRVEQGSADAVASDDILLQGHIAQARAKGKFLVVGELLSYEVYGIMFARDDSALAETVQAAFRQLATAGAFREIYEKWFMKTLPSGVRLGVPMSAHLERSFDILQQPTGF